MKKEIIIKMPKDAEDIQAAPSLKKLSLQATVMRQHAIKQMICLVDKFILLI